MTVFCLASFSKDSEYFPFYLTTGLIFAAIFCLKFLTGGMLECMSGTLVLFITW